MSQRNSNRPVTFSQHPHERFEQSQEELAEVEIRIVIRRGLHAWCRFAHFQLMQASFGPRWMRRYLCISRGCVHFARWQRYATQDHREALVEEVIGLRWEIYQFEEQQRVEEDGGEVDEMPDVMPDEHARAFGRRHRSFYQDVMGGRAPSPYAGGPTHPGDPLGASSSSSGSNRHTRT